MEHSAGKVIAIFNKLSGARMCAVENINHGTITVHQLRNDSSYNLSRDSNMKFQIGDKVEKITGYKYPGIVVSVFVTTEKKLRYVVEADHRDFEGMLHIYSPEQLQLRESV